MPASGRQVQKPRPKVVRQQRVGIGADGVEGDVAEVEQPGEPDHDVQPPAEHDVGQHQRCRGRARSGRPMNGSATAAASSDGATSRPARVQRLRQAAVGPVLGLRGRRRGTAAGASRPRNTAATTASRAQAAGSAQHEAASGPISARSPTIGPNRPSAHERRQARPGRRRSARRAHTFSTSARPSSPVGRKISTMTRMQNAATSLYWTLK